MMSNDVPRSVLIVEDDGDFAESLADMLIPRGFRPIIAETSEAAVKIMAGASGGSPPVAPSICASALPASIC